jgi:hypothetical protein
MHTVLEIEIAIKRLPKPEQRKIAECFEDHRLIVATWASLASIDDDEDGGREPTRRRMNRGEIRLADLRYLGKVRPVLILSIAPGEEDRALVTIAGKCPLRP